MIGRGVRPGGKGGLKNICKVPFFLTFFMKKYSFLLTICYHLKWSDGYFFFSIYDLPFRLASVDFTWNLENSLLHKYWGGYFSIPCHHFETIYWEGFFIKINFNTPPPPPFLRCSLWSLHSVWKSVFIYIYDIQCLLCTQNRRVTVYSVTLMFCNQSHGIFNDEIFTCKKSIAKFYLILKSP